MATQLDERTVTVNLGDESAVAARFLRSGRYTSLDEVMQAALEALEREETLFDAILKQKVEESLADPRPTVSLEEGFAEVRRRIAERWGTHGV